MERRRIMNQEKRSGSAYVEEALTELKPGEEPVTTGTLFFVVILLMIISAVWVIMYLRLLDR
jgi:hypothetical protein